MLDIAVVGCGTAGLAAACFLARAGHQVTMLERFAEPRAVGAGLLLQPTGLAILDRLGLLEAALLEGQVVHGIHGMTCSGREIFAVDYERLGPGLAGLGIHRGTLFTLLFDEARRLGVPIKTGADIADTTLRGDKRVVLDMAGHDLGAYDLVVDAGGARSVLRSAHAEVLVDKPYPYGAVWGIVEVPAAWEHKSRLAQVYDRASVMIGLLPVGRQPGRSEPLAAFFWSLKRGDFAAWRLTSFQDWQDRVLRYWPQAEPFVRQLRSHDDLARAEYGDVILRRPDGERLVFIGDAAHATSPQLGQGANLALIDAAALADKLQSNAMLDTALREYARQRHAHTRFYQAASRLLTPFFQSDSRLASWLRDVAFPPLGRFDFVQGQMVRTLAGMKTGLFSSMPLQNVAHIGRAIESLGERQSSVLAAHA